MTIKDSGERRNFGTGSVRDMAEGKGRMDLTPLFQVAQLFDGSDKMALCYMDNFLWSGDTHYLKEAIAYVILKYFKDRPTAILELSIHYEEGCNKYGDRNWQIGDGSGNGGIPVHCYIDSAARHYMKLIRGDTDERHDRAVLWNLFSAWWTMDNKPEMVDLPIMGVDV